MNETSGVPSFDTLIEGGLHTGDNIVWMGETSREPLPMVDAFMSVGTGLRLHLCLSPTGDCDHRDGSEVVHLADEAGHVDVSRLERLLTGPEVTDGSRVVVSSLDDLVTALGVQGTVDLYQRCCPRLFDRGALAYWIGGRDLVGATVIDRIGRIAQCVFELRADRLRIVKAEGRSSGLQGAVAGFAVIDGVVEVSREHTVGRLGVGLRRIRGERILTQAQLAGIAGVTPAAISQAETGRRGLSLDTLVPLCEALGVGLDDLLGTGRPEGPLLARRDREPGPGPASPMFDDPRLGPRATLVELAQGSSWSPPFSTKGPELILVADGLVLVDLGETTPVLRVGDGLLVTEAHLRSCTNLDPRVARLFWVVVS